MLFNHESDKEGSLAGETNDYKSNIFMQSFCHRETFHFICGSVLGSPLNVETLCIEKLEKKMCLAVEEVKKAKRLNIFSKIALREKEKIKIRMEFVKTVSV